MSDYDDKNRGRSKYKNIHILKKNRKNEIFVKDILPLKTSNKVIDLPAFNMYAEKRFRTESPPPKHHRRRNGFNKGKYPCCSFCRPEISKRAYRTSVTRSEMRQCNKMKTVREFEDIYGSMYYDYDKGYESE
jgi:hypothetical protein